MFRMTVKYYCIFFKLEVYNLYHPQNYHLMNNLVLVICCAADKKSGNFFFNPDNENRNYYLVLLVKISIMS